MKYDLDEILDAERTRCMSYVYTDKPFSFLPRMNNKYFNNKFNNGETHDRVLDQYNYLKNIGTKNYLIEFSLMATLEQMIIEHNKELR